MSLILKGSFLVALLTLSTSVLSPAVERISKKDSKERQCLIEAVSHEALNQPVNGQKAVLDVITNRVNTKGFPDSICAVVQASKAFSYRNHLKPGKIVYKIAKNSKDAVALQKIENLVDFYLHGNYKPVLGSKVLWYTRKEIQTVWMKKMKVHAIIQDHKFLEEV